MSAPSRVGRRVLVAGGAIFVVLFALGTVPRLRHRDELKALASEAEAAPIVRTVTVHGAPPASELTLPGALAGIAWMLYVTLTTLSVPSLMGAIMCVGVATANSILLVVFANDQREEGMDARSAALSAGHTRIRPVIMTAGAMIIGMLPMALGLGEGGEQNAPLGRAVIGGLLLATVATLFFVPVAYSVLRRATVGAPQMLPEPEAA